MNALSQSRIAEMRAHAFGLHFYTLGTDAWTGQLIDWQTKGDRVIWETSDEYTFDALIEAMYRTAHEHRAHWATP